MPHEFDLDGIGIMPDGKPNGGSYNPADYGLPVWRDEDHLPPEKETEAKVDHNPDVTNMIEQPVVASACGMTVSEAQNKLCLYAKSQVGYHEGANNWNQYAEDPDIQKLYGWKPQNTYWCDTFADDCYVHVFGLEAASRMTYQPIGQGSALCKTSAQYYMDHGAFFQTPELGDQAFFYVGGSIEHTGIVVGVDGGSVITVEGNSSDMVAERIYSISDKSRIAGFGRPDWSIVTGVAVDTPVTVSTQSAEPAALAQRTFGLRFPYLKRGSTGAFVIAVQFELMGQGYSVGPDGADGEFGGNTEEAVKEFQLNVHLTADGVVGPETAARLFGGEVVTQAQTVQPAQETKKEVEQLTEEETRNGLFELFKKLWRKEQ